MAANASALLVANLATAVVVGRRWLRRPHPVDLLSRGSRAASTSDWPGCAPCFAGNSGLSLQPTRDALSAELEHVGPQVLAGSLQAIRSKRKSAASRQR
jgi:hypothetical protein